ncbi:hypothetical protein DSO57_1029114 [Entomophthora muscae]|uniref:Uncharacterized protein n=1 Tax=Entomophthora muscae TaxID=34485 RepID=A0ACC2SE68_9FUNG|nr:hypothetical protein DSO57_1029114 [Entomophthora muscae]
MQAHKCLSDHSKFGDRIGDDPMTPTTSSATSNDQPSKDRPLEVQEAVPEDLKHATQIAQQECLGASTDLPANVSYDTQGMLNELPLDVSNNMN